MMYRLVRGLAGWLSTTESRTHTGRAHLPSGWMLMQTRTLSWWWLDRLMSMYPQPECGGQGMSTFPRPRLSSVLSTWVECLFS